MQIVVSSCSLGSIPRNRLNGSKTGSGSGEIGWPHPGYHICEKFRFSSVRLFLPLGFYLRLLELMAIVHDQVLTEEFNTYMGTVIITIHRLKGLHRWFSRIRMLANSQIQLGTHLLANTRFCFIALPTNRIRSAGNQQNEHLDSCERKEFQERFYEGLQSSKTW